MRYLRPASLARRVSGVCIVVMAAVLFTVTARAQGGAPTPGIDCDCTETGSYVRAHAGVNPAVVLEDAVGAAVHADDPNLSPGETYRVAVSSGANTVSTLTVSENTSGGDILVNRDITNLDVSWGFSPDEDRFVLWSVSGITLTAELYDLSIPSGSRLVETYNATVPQGTQASVTFSAGGDYLLVATAPFSNTTRLGVISSAGVSKGAIEFNGTGRWSVSPDGQRLVVQTQSSVNLYDLSGATAQLIDAQPFATDAPELGFSPDGSYLLSAVTGGSGTSVRVVDASGQQVLTQQFTGDAAWGFSPDGERLAVWTFSGSQLSVRLYDLTANNPSQPVATYPATLYTGGGGTTARLRFSANGEYLMVASVAGQTSTRLGLIHRTGRVAHDETISYAASADTSGQSFGGATWGFSRDDADRSLAYAWNSGATTVQWRLVNLAAGAIVEEQPIQNATSGYWSFSPCGDVAALVMQQNAQAQANVSLIATKDGEDLGQTTAQLSGIDIRSTATDHLVQSVAVADNTAAGTCVLPDLLQSITVSPAGLAGGETATVTIQLSRDAGTDAVVVLTSTGAALDIPATVTVPSGQSVAAFELVTVPVASDQSVTITASLEGVTKSGTLQIRAPQLTEFDLYDDEVAAGQQASGSATLSSPAPAGGLSIVLQSSHPAVLPVPATITASPEENWAELEDVAAARVEAPVQVVVTATLGAVTLKDSVLVRPGVLADFTLGGRVCRVGGVTADTLALVGGRPLRLTVSLDGLPRLSGSTVTLQSSNAAVVSLPSSVELDTSMQVEVIATTAAVTQDRAVTLTATMDDVTIEVPVVLVAAPVTFSATPILGPPGATNVAAGDLNNLGEVAGTYSDGSNGFGFIWRSGVTQTLDLPAYGYSFGNVTDINDFGAVTGVGYTATGGEGLVWENGRPRVLAVPGLHTAGPVAINNAGQIAVQAHLTATGGAQSGLLSGGRLQLLGEVPGAYANIPYGLNNHGDYVGTATYASAGMSVKQLGFLVEAGPDTLLPLPVGLANTVATDVNDHGQVAGYHTSFGLYPEHAVIWEDGQFQFLSPSFGRGEARAIDNSGRVVGQVTRGNGEDGSLEFLPMYYEDGRMYDLNCLIPEDAGITLTEAGDINDQGQIVAGRMSGDSGSYGTYLLTPSGVATGVDLAVTMTAAQDTIPADSSATYAVMLTNEGSAAAEDVKLFISLGGDSLYVASTAGAGTCAAHGAVVTCSLPELAAGAQASYSVTVRPDSGGTYPYGAVAYGRAFDEDIADNAVQDTLTVTGATGTAAEESEGPLVMALEQNAPNPARGRTRIGYTLPETGPVTLRIYDLLGRQVATPVRGTAAAGRYELVFDGAALPSGVYVYRLEAGGQVLTRRMVLVR